MDSKLDQSLTNPNNTSINHFNPSNPTSGELNAVIIPAQPNQSNPVMEFDPNRSSEIGIPEVELEMEIKERETYSQQRESISP